VLPPLGGFDLSPLVALFGISILQQIIQAILDGFR
jgi:uncharacterized protein YggT (Ycf19 family)